LIGHDKIGQNVVEFGMAKKLLNRLNIVALLNEVTGERASHARFIFGYLKDERGNTQFMALCT
jgi:hypothetical protein